MRSGAFDDAVSSTTLNGDEEIPPDTGRSLVCSECGYGIVARGELPTCPMCQSSSWDPEPWRPFSLADDLISRASLTARSNDRA